MTSFSGCVHKEFLIITEFVDSTKIVKEHICENCGTVFKPCVVDESMPKTSEHLKECSACDKPKAKKEKFRIVKDEWQEFLLAKTSPKKKIKRIA